VTNQAWLEATTATFRSHDIDSARLDSLLLLCDELGHDKAWVFAHPDDTLQIENVHNLSTKVVRRARHEPMAYIRERVEFYGREFYVDEHVLVPRPESEAIIELLIELSKAPKATSGMTIADIGSGSGALAISAACELRDANILASDIDQTCLDIVLRNARQNQAVITCVQGDLLQPYIQAGLTPNILICNLPYVPTAHEINKAARHEPALALYGGDDGLDLYRTLFEQAPLLPVSPAYVITESLETQHQVLASIANHSGYALRETRGLAQLFQHI
jgi:release factor glutamine methyltransferase